MFNYLRGNNTKGFTLIELLVVIAIIGILAAIAIPNFISYRNKSFCSAAESDANAIAGGLADYFAIPSITDVPLSSGNTIDLSRPGAPNAEIALSGTNTGTIGDDIDPNNGITITVTDQSGRCPDDYTTPAAEWGGADTASSVYTKIMRQ